MTVIRAAWMSLVLALVSSASFAQGSETVVYFHADAIGSTRLVTGANGAVVDRYDYLPFGEPWASSGLETRRFGGKERDSETGLDYFGARYYASQTGRFTMLDPALDQEKALVDPQRWNRYAYALNNPLKFVDPDGREPAITNRQLDFELPKWGYAVFGASTLAGAVALAGPTAWRVAVGCVLSPSCQSSALDILEGAAGGPPRIGPSGLSTGADEAVFWSGIRGADSAAAKWIGQKGGATLEGTLAARGITLPTFEPNNPAVVAAWREASREFAAGARGNVRVLQSKIVGRRSIWAEVEFPTLKANPNVRSITAIDPETGLETVLWSR